MAIINEDEESRGQEQIRESLLQDEKSPADGEYEPSQKSSQGHHWMVYFSTFVSVCGSFEFGSCVSAFSWVHFSRQAYINA